MNEVDKQNKIQGYKNNIAQQVAMKQQVKLVVAEHLNSQQTQFLIYMSEQKKLGEGSFGVVRRAIKNDGSNELFAVKIIPYKDEDKRQKIQKQIKMLRNLPKHQNLVSIQQIKCFSTNNYYIFMQYCEGGTLEDERRLKKNKYTQNEIYNIFYQLMNGYKILWNQKILHQDIKLQNVLIKNGMYKFTDFGFSIFYSGVKFGDMREGTLPYMPLQKLTQKDYYATTKSDVYAMGVLFFKLITGNFPYVASGKAKDTKTFVKYLRDNQLQLIPGFINKFSIKFKHFFQLVVKMVSKKQCQRINFDTIYQYIQNQQIFDNIRKRVSEQEKSLKAENQKLVIANKSQAVAINFTVSESQEIKFRNELLQKSKNKLSEQQKNILQQINDYIICNRILIYYFDRLIRRLYINKLRKKYDKNKQQKQMIQKLILGLMLFCRKIINNLLIQYKNGNKYNKKYWKIYHNINNNIIIRIQKDQNYLIDFFIDFVTEKNYIKIQDKKLFIDQCKGNFLLFKNKLICLLQSCQKLIIPIQKQQKQDLITFCYINKGIQILKNDDKQLKYAMDLQKYFRIIQTENQIVLKKRINQICSNNTLHFYGITEIQFL